LIESADGSFGYGTVGVVDKREATRPARFSIDGKNYLGGFTDARQMLT
jgi:hypothetical protein